MTLEEIIKFFEDNREKDDVKGYLEKLSAVSVDRLEGFLILYSALKLHI